MFVRSVECCHKEEMEEKESMDDVDGSVAAQEGVDYERHHGHHHHHRHQHRRKEVPSIQHIRIPMVNRKPVKFRWVELHRLSLSLA